MTDEFRLLTSRPAHHDPAAARARLLARKRPGALHDLQTGAAHYQLDPRLEVSVNVALAVRAPLLLTGEPGTGKTQLAWYLADFFGLPLHSYVVRSTSTAESLKYDFDAVGYLHWAQAGATEIRRRRDFLREGPLWRAYEETLPAVLLIDEIDKAPRDFPNDLLHELDQHAFPHPFPEKDNPKETITPKAGPPIVVITSNVERRLPDAFLRRCVHHHVELTEKLVLDAVKARRTRDSTLDAEAEKVAIARFQDLRARQLSKPPSLGELLAWLVALETMRVSAEALKSAALAELPALGCLVKDEKDRKRL